jgi:hypothetical protein
MKLSPNQLAMLCIIDEATLWDNGEVKRYWSPHDRRESYVDVAGFRAEFYVFGAGVVQSIKALDAKGLTARYRNSGYDVHSRYVTEAGRVYIEELRSAARPNRLD